MQRRTSFSCSRLYLSNIRAMLQHVSDFGDLIVHLVFSTKNRLKIITPEIEPNLFKYIGGILRNLESTLLCAGGTSDHVHLLVSQSKKVAISCLLQNIKTDSSRWIKTQGMEFRKFHWQDGYGAFSVSQKDILD